MHRKDELIIFGELIMNILEQSFLLYNLTVTKFWIVEYSVKTFNIKFR